MALIVIVAVMNILVAASLPYWSQVMKRDREAELVFRGLQYAEAIRVFQLRFNRLPNTLDELIEVNPRSIRRLWKDPMSDSGEWELIRAQAGRAAGGRGRELAGGSAPGGRQAPQQGRGQAGRQGAPGPILGVRSRSDDESFRTFMGASSYSKWQFTVDLIPVPTPIADSLLVPRPTSDWIGKPFREGLEPQQGSGPGQDLGAPQRRGEDD
ncbi:MAG: Tfp pilus assembly protein FimT/FimU [Thermoanaerobaculia bacterium]